MRVDGAAPLLLPAEPLRGLAEYRALGGGAALLAVAADGGQGAIEAIGAAGIRGRGGAGFPAARKWASIAGTDVGDGDRFVVANGAEGEPATFKDRMLMRHNPYQVLEGLLIAAEVVGARDAFIAMKASFGAERAAVERAIAEMTDAGWVRVPVHVVAGPEEYLFGEEKALLEVIEGEEPLPRHLPPYEYGLFSSSPNLGWSANLDRSSSGPAEPSANPTLVNNVETLAAVAAALRVGPDRFLAHGDGGGPMLVTVCGATRRAGVAEVSFGIRLGEVIEKVGGGLHAGRRLKAVLSGVANPVPGADAADLALSYEAFTAAGSGLGAAGFWVLDDSADMAAVAAAVAWFLHVESCGQCSPCKMGTGSISQVLHRVCGGSTLVSDPGLLARALSTVTDGARCHLPVQARDVVSSIVAAFPDDFAARPAGPIVPVAVPKLVDIVDGEAVYDERQAHKRPDWTYADTPVTVTVGDSSSLP